jgi:hypothetical protein
MGVIELCLLVIHMWYSLSVPVAFSPLYSLIKKLRSRTSSDPIHLSDIFFVVLSQVGWTNLAHIIDLKMKSQNLGYIVSICDMTVYNKSTSNQYCLISDFSISLLFTFQCYWMSVKFSTKLFLLTNILKPQKKRRRERLQ